jgi:hypothetical protein
VQKEVRACRRNGNAAVFEYAESPLDLSAMFEYIPEAWQTTSSTFLQH